MDINLPWGTGLNACNPKSISLIEQKGYVVIDGGAAKCRKLDSKFYDVLVRMGYRGASLVQNIESDWIVSKDRDNRRLVFSYINPFVGSVDFIMNSNSFVVSGNRISARSIDDNNTYKIKVSETAGQNLSYLKTHYNI